MKGNAIIARLLPTVRTRSFIQRLERWLLSPMAFRSAASRGREKVEAPCDFRTPFARDRDRIIHSYLYTLLGGKTQVFASGSLPLEVVQKLHNRSIHVQKVAQIARDICRALGLNEDLAEAIALGHDLGHSPFGHEGEKVLSELSQKHLGVPFKHNRQSLRAVAVIENLNLSFEVLDGILRHDGEKKDHVLVPHQQAGSELSDADFPTTMEGCVVRLADRIAYLPLDLADGLLLGLVREEEIPVQVRETLGATPREMIDTLVKDVIANSAGRNIIAMSDQASQALDALFDFNYRHIYFCEVNLEFRKTLRLCLETIFYYLTGPAGRSPQAAIDQIVGLTDHQALKFYQEITQRRSR